MNEAQTLILACITGSFLGTIFFGGLWFTIRRAINSPQPVIWFMGSLLLRMGITLAGFYFIADGQWQRLLACLSGFIMARIIITRLTRAGKEPEYATQS